jgi:thioredoxin reductase
VGLQAEDELVEQVGEGVPEVYAIGDCREPRKVINAIWEGFRAARLI